MHCCIVKYFAFNCTPDWSILFGALFAWQIFRSAGRQQQAGSSRQAVSFPIFQLPYIATPCICRHLAPFYWLPSSFLGSQFLFTFAASLWLALPRSICCFWNIFNKTLYAFHFCNNCAALSSGIWSICLECWRTISSMLPVLPASLTVLPACCCSVYIFRMFTSGIKLNVY